MTVSDATLGNRVCSAAFNEPCDGFFGFGRGAFTEIGSVTSPKAGDSVVVKLSDPSSLLSDTRRIIMIFDNDPLRVFKVANQQEGTIQSYDITETPDANSIHLWVDNSDVEAVDLRLLRTPDARRIVADGSKSFGDVIADAGEALKEEREAADKRARNLMILGGVLVVVIVIAAAYALPKIKIPKVGVS